MYIYICLYVCEHTRLLWRTTICIIHYHLSFLIVHVKGNERVKKRKTSVHLIRIHDDKKKKEKRDMIYIFNRRSDCHHLSFLYFDHHLTTSTWCFLFNRGEKSFFEALDE